MRFEETDMQNEVSNQYNAAILEITSDNILKIKTFLSNKATNIIAFSHICSLSP